jgi:hypothetical protein
MEIPNPTHELARFVIYLSATLLDFPFTGTGTNKTRYHFPLFAQLTVCLPILLVFCTPTFP